MFLTKVLTISIFLFRPCFAKMGRQMGWTGFFPFEPSPGKNRQVSIPTGWRDQSRKGENCEDRPPLHSWVGSNDLRWGFTKDYQIIDKV